MSPTVEPSDDEPFLDLQNYVDRRVAGTEDKLAQMEARMQAQFDEIKNLLRQR